MKSFGDKSLLMISAILGFFGYLFLLCPDSSAAEGPTSGRMLWDNIMLVVNFLILVFIFLKYARKPLMEFIRGIRKKIEDELNNVEGNTRNAKSILKEQTEKLDDVDKRIDEIRKSIIDMGQREREKVIAQAKIAAEKMIQDAKAYSEYRLAKAKKALSDEVVDLAVSIVEKKLTELISEKDNEKLLDEFVAGLETSNYLNH